MRIVLASASPRRKELLGMLGLEFEIMVSDVEEVVTETTPNRVVEQLSQQKAEDIFKRLEGDVLVIGADTVVSLDGNILGKPKNEADAVEMLERLQDNEHRVFTGVTLIGRKEGKEFRNAFSEGTVVKEPMDKAGSYGIQGLGARFVECIHGDYNNVVGLPIARLYQEMKLL